MNSEKMYSSTEVKEIKSYRQEILNSASSDLEWIPHTDNINIVRHRYLQPPFVLIGEEELYYIFLITIIVIKIKIQKSY